MFWTPPSYSVLIDPHSFPLEKKMVDLLTFYTLLASTVFEKKTTNLICIEFWIAYLLDNYLLPLSRGSIIHWGQEPAYDLFWLGMNGVSCLFTYVWWLSLNIWFICCCITYKSCVPIQSVRQLCNHLPVESKYQRMY